MRFLPVLLAGTTAALAAYAWATYQQRWTPDFELYTQGGVGLYPSPVGRLLGNLGETGFAAVSALAAGVSVWVVSSRSWARGAVLMLSPVLLYLTFASADVIALGLYAAWLATTRHWLFTLGVFTHFALLPYALLHLAVSPRLSGLQKLLAGYFLGGTAVIVLLVTPYGGIVFVDRGFWAAAVYGLALAALISLPALIFFRPGPVHWLAFGVGALECGLQNHAQARYFLPAILLLAATGAPRFGEVLTPSGGSYRFGLTPRRPSGKVGVAPRSMGRQRVGQVPAAYATSRKEP